MLSYAEHATCMYMYNVVISPLPRFGSAMQFKLCLKLIMITECAVATNHSKNYHV